MTPENNVLRSYMDETERIFNESFSNRSSDPLIDESVRLYFKAFLLNSQLGLIKKVVEMVEGLNPKDSPYVRNHVLPPHRETTLTNAYRKGFKDALADIINKLNKI